MIYVTASYLLVLSGKEKHGSLVDSLDLVIETLPDDFRNVIEVVYHNA